MPDAQTLNAIMKSYGMSGPSGGWNWGVILGGIVFSIVGWYAFRHGRKEKSLPPTVTGIALMVYPYFIGNPWIFYLVGFGLCAALYFWRD